MDPAATPSFDTWTSFFLLVCSFGFFLTIILFANRKALKVNLPIILLVLGFSFILLQYVFYWTGYLQTYPYLYFYDNSWYLLFGPLLYGYITRFYNPNFKIHWSHYFPVFISVSLNVFYFIKTNGYMDWKDFQNENLYHFFRAMRSPWLAGISLAVYIFICRDFIKFNKSSFSSQYQRLREKWANFLIALFTVFVVAYLSYFVLVIFPFFNPQWDYAISFAMSAAIYGIGYMVYREPSIFNGELMVDLFVKETNSPTFSEETTAEFYTTLLKYIEENKPYLDNNLRLVQLADDVGFSSHTLSKIINDKAEKNFNQFINEFRLREAERLIVNKESMPIKSIYYEVGFNNKATFYKAFRSKYHCTPLEFKENVESQE